MTPTLAPPELGRVCIEESRNDSYEEQQMHEKKSKYDPYHRFHPPNRSSPEASRQRRLPRLLCDGL